MIIILKNCDGDNECFHYICRFWYDRYIILVATSGDTGSAVLDGFRRHAGTVNTNTTVIFSFYTRHTAPIYK